MEASLGRTAPFPRVASSRVALTPGTAPPHAARGPSGLACQQKAGLLSRGPAGPESVVHSSFSTEPSTAESYSDVAP